MSEDGGGTRPPTPAAAAEAAGPFGSAPMGAEPSITVTSADEPVMHARSNSGAQSEPPAPLTGGTSLRPSARGSHNATPAQGSRRASRIASAEPEPVVDPIDALLEVPALAIDRRVPRRALARRE